MHHIEHFNSEGRTDRQAVRRQREQCELDGARASVRVMSFNCKGGSAKLDKAHLCWAVSTWHSQLIALQEVRWMPREVVKQLCLDPIEWAFDGHKEAGFLYQRSALHCRDIRHLLTAIPAPHTDQRLGDLSAEFIRRCHIAIFTRRDCGDSEQPALLRDADAFIACSYHGETSRDLTTRKTVIAVFLRWFSAVRLRLCDALTAEFPDMDASSSRHLRLPLVVLGDFNSDLGGEGPTDPVGVELPAGFVLASYKRILRPSTPPPPGSKKKKGRVLWESEQKVDDRLSQEEWERLRREGAALRTIDGGLTCSPKGVHPSMQLSHVQSFQVPGSQSRRDISEEGRLQLVKSAGLTITPALATNHDPVCAILNFSTGRLCCRCCSTLPVCLPDSELCHEPVDHATCVDCTLRCSQCERERLCRTCAACSTCTCGLCNDCCSTALCAGVRCDEKVCEDCGLWCDGCGRQYCEECIIQVGSPDKAQLCDICQDGDDWYLDRFDGGDAAYRTTSDEESADEESVVGTSCLD